MARNDPFSGLPLSEQVPGGKLDQRLFATGPKVTVPPKVTKPGGLPDRGTASSPKQAPAPTLAQRVAELKPSSIASSHFDLSELPLYKASYVFTVEELEALEDLKIQLHRELGAKVTKNDLVRCALHLLVEDYRTKTDQSYATRKIGHRSERNR